MVYLHCSSDITKKRFTLLKSEGEAIRMLQKIIYSHTPSHHSPLIILDIKWIDSPSNDHVEYWYEREIDTVDKDRVINVYLNYPLIPYKPKQDIKVEL